MENMAEDILNCKSATKWTEICVHTSTLRLQYTHLMIFITKFSKYEVLKSVHVHFAPGSNGRSFPLEYS